MHLQTHTWEANLLHLASGARPAAFSRPLAFEVDAATLDAAYAYCEELTAVHSRSFHLASGLLPRAKRRAARALYAFCRTCDDLVDCAEGGDIETELIGWRQRTLHLAPEPTDYLAVAWADARRRFQIPLHFAEQLIDGVRRDLYQTRYATFHDLAAYSYGVASTVGLMSMHIIGFSGSAALPYAIKLGVALQLTNILRDVGEDWRSGRLYLPQEELAHFGLDESAVAAGRVGQRWRRFMDFQIQRNRRLYAEALPGIGLLDQDGRFGIAAAAELYRAILDDIEKEDYDVFKHRAHVTGVGKLRKLPGIWWRSRMLRCP